MTHRARANLRFKHQGLHPDKGIVVHHDRAVYLNLMGERDSPPHIDGVPLPIDRADVFFDCLPVHLRLKRVYDDPVLDI